jgi:hypothetical protein
MISRRAKVFAAATLSALVLASPALAGGWGYGPRYGGWGYGRGGWGGGPGWGAAAAAGALGGLAVGLIASQAAVYPNPYPYYYGPRCRVVNQPVLDAYGYVVGYRPAQVCG